MLLLKKSLREKDYGAGIEDDLRHAFDGRFRVEPDIVTSLGMEWDRWERMCPNNGCEHRDRFTVSDEGNYCMVRFRKSVFWGDPGYERLAGTATKEIAVYRDCIAHNGTIYKRKDVNR